MRKEVHLIPENESNFGDVKSQSDHKFLEDNLMKKFSLVFTILILISLIPASAFASTPQYYCSAFVTSGGDGSYDHPWPCTNQAQLDAAVAQVCKAGYGILYEEVANGYWRHTVEDPTDGPCKVTSSVFYYGLPPDTGILPVPLLIGGALALGIALIAGGFFVYKKRYA
jgi:hypothetical protein